MRHYRDRGGPRRLTRGGISAAIEAAASTSHPSPAARNSNAIVQAVARPKCALEPTRDERQYIERLFGLISIGVNITL